MSLASVLVMRANSRWFAPSVGRERVGRRLAFRRVRVLQLAEQRLERQALAFEIEPQRRHRVVEQPVPRGGAADRLLQEQLLEFVGELMRLLLADVLEPRTIMAERRRPHRRLEPRVVEPVELELEEQEIAGERGHPLVRVAIELRAGGVAGVGGVEQRRIGHDAADQVLHRFVGFDRRRQRLARSGRSAHARACRARSRRSAWLAPRRARDRRRSAANPCPRRDRRAATPAIARDPPTQASGARAASREWRRKLIDQASLSSC